MRLDADAAPRFGTFTLRTDCPRCGAHLPVNGPVAAVDCADCGARVDVPGDLVGGLADRFEESWPTARASDTVTTGDLTWRWTFTAATGLACACGAPLSADETLAACASCGAHTAAFDAPSGLTKAAPSARRVYGADEDGTRPVIALAPVAMGCPQCGAGLAITAAHQRLTPCTHCGVTVHLPDAVWRQLHPPRTVRPWTVRFDGESRPARRARIARERADAERRQREQKEAARLRAQAAEMERQRAEAAAIEERRAAAAAAKAEEEKRWRRVTVPLLVLSWAALPVTLGGMIAGTAWYTIGAPTLLIGRVAPRILHDAGRVVVVAAAVAAVLGWALSAFAAARRSRVPLGAILPRLLLHVATALVPLVGWCFALVWAFRLAIGTEPKVEGGPERLPRVATLPLAAYFLAFSGYVYVLLGALADVTLGALQGHLPR